MVNDLKNKSAFITIVGVPNVGKSSLLNELIGHKISIVSKKPQTTRNRIMGILTQNNTQLIFIDTPGIHTPRTTLGKYMVGQINTSISDVDACMMVVEAGKTISQQEETLIKRLSDKNVPTILVINKIDLLNAKSSLAKQIDSFSKKFKFEAVIPTSTKSKYGISDVLKELQKFSKPGGYIFESDALTDQPERLIISEIIREKLLRLLEQEVPHGVAVKIDQMKDHSGIMDIYATIYCEKETHKGIIIGKYGSMLKKVGTFARQDIESFFEYKVNLQLWVKVKEDWRNRQNLVIPFIYEDLDKGPL